MTNIPDPVLFWFFDENGGTTAASKPGGELITLDRSAFVAGRISSAILFDPTKGAQNVTTTIPPRKPPYTLAVWVRRDAETSSSTLLSGPDTAFKLEQYSFLPPHSHYVGMTKYSYDSTDGFDADFGVAVPLGEWTFLVFVADGTDTKLYVNGTLQGTVQKSIDLQMNWLGSSRDGVEFVQMTMGELRVYDVALDADQVPNIFNGLALPPSISFKVTGAERIPACSVLKNPVTVGVLSSPLTANIDFTTTVTIPFAPNTPFAVSLDAGLGKGSFVDLDVAGGGRYLTGTQTKNQVPYQLYTDSERIVVWGDGTGGSMTVCRTADAAGTPVELTIYGRVPLNVPGGNTPLAPAVDQYQDCITIYVDC